MSGTLYFPTDVPFTDPATQRISTVWLRFLNEVQAGLSSVPWASIDFTGSTFADIVTRSASALNTGTVPLARISGLTDAQIAAGAAIAYTKLSLALSIVNADISASAAIAYSKLASMTDARLLGRSSGSNGTPIEITVGAGLSLAAGALTATGTTPTTGTWTPSDASGAGLALTIANAQYFKMDTLVVAACDVTYPATADGSASLIGGLPFTSIATSNAMWGGSINFSDEATAAQVRINPSATTFRVATSTGGVITNATLSGNQLRLTMTYRT